MEIKYYRNEIKVIKLLQMQIDKQISLSKNHYHENCS